MEELFVRWRPKGSSLQFLGQIIEVLEAYAKQGYHLTIRQLYYQLVSRGYLPNNIRAYQAVVRITGRARLAGLIDWEAIEDRVRTSSHNTHWESPAQIVQAAVHSYYEDRWKNQDEYMEVWCEKDAVSNILEPVCRKWDVTFMVNRGYSSLSAMYSAYKRFDLARQADRVLCIIYFGDHDPSGVDMIRDIDDRICRAVS